MYLKRVSRRKSKLIAGPFLIAKTRTGMHGPASSRKAKTERMKLKEKEKSEKRTNEVPNTLVTNSGSQSLLSLNDVNLQIKNQR